VLAVPEKVPYFSVAWPDHEGPPETYWLLLGSTMWHILKCGLLPCVVHCRAGQMRSPAVAAWLASLDAYEPSSPRLPAMLDTARALRPDICYQNGELKPYVRSLLAYIKATWK
jgi:hypothetical protein